MQYQTAPTQHGGWYISDYLRLKRRGEKDSLELLQAREKTRIRGPLNSESEANILKEELEATNPNLRGHLWVWQADYNTAQMEATLSETIGIIANANAAHCYKDRIIVKEEVRKHLLANNAIASCFQQDDVRHQIGKKIEYLSDQEKAELIEKRLNILKRV